MFFNEPDIDCLTRFSPVREAAPRLDLNRKPTLQGSKTDFYTSLPLLTRIAIAHAQHRNVPP